MCESVFPSAWRYGPLCGTSRSKIPSKSDATSGSACSLIITPAVVCGTYTWQIPSLAPVSATAFSTCRVTSTNCVRRDVFTRNVSIICSPNTYKKGGQKRRGCRSAVPHRPQNVRRVSRCPAVRTQQSTTGFGDHTKNTYVHERARFKRKGGGDYDADRQPSIIREYVY